jgi:excisionase family DNA binding protein
MDEFFTVRQISIILKMHHLTIRKYITEGRLKAIKIGRSVRITKNDLQLFIENYGSSQKTTRHIRLSPEAKPFQSDDAFLRINGRGISLDKY